MVAIVYSVLCAAYPSHEYIWYILDLAMLEAWQKKKLSRNCHKEYRLSVLLSGKYKVNW